MWRDLWGNFCDEFRKNSGRCFEGFLQTVQEQYNGEILRELPKETPEGIPVEISGNIFRGSFGGTFLEIRGNPGVMSIEK